MIFNRIVNARCSTVLLLVAWTTGQTAWAATPKSRPGKANRVIETANFRVYGIGALNEAGRIAGDLESLRSRLSETWLDQKRLPAWSPKCEVVVHATVASYVQAAGQDQFATAGASRIDFATGRILLRRIDVRADQAGWFAAALPHELTHVVLADEFLGRELPNWADEGMAVLADPTLKQSLHLRDFQAGRTRGADFRLAEFVGQRCYPAAARIPVFYGQSVSLVKFLVDRKSPADFVRFLHLGEKVGFDAAVAEAYGFGGLADLERRWLDAAAAGLQRQEMLASATVWLGGPAGARPPLAW